MEERLIRFEFIESEQIHTIVPLLKMLAPGIGEEVLHGRLDEMMTQGYRCIGIFDEERLVGICGIWVLTKYYVGRHIEPDNVFILPEYRDRGIGTDLMAWIYEYAEQTGCSASELNCYVGNKNAQRFWEKEGYEVIGLHYQKKFDSDG